MQHKYSNKLGLYYLFTLLCYNTASARLERRNIAIAFPRQYPDSGSLDYPQNEDYPKLFVNEDVLTVVISGTNPAVAGLTNAVTVTIGAKTGSTTANPTTDPIKGPAASSNPSPTDSQPTSVSVTSSQSASASTITTIASSLGTTQTNPPSSTTSSSSPSTGSSSPVNNSVNLQTFTGALGNIPAPAVSDAGNGNFLVEGNSSFDKKENALTRSCSVQHNNCANAANAAHNNAFTVNDCDAQQSQCNAVAGSPS